MSNPRKTKAGGISIYNMIQSNSGEVHLERVHEKFLFSGTCVLKFKKEISTLLVGTTCGEIHIFKIYIREKAHIARELVEQIGLIKAHQARIVGLDVDTKTGYIFSTAAEGQLVISEQNYQCIIKKIEISKTRLTTLTFLEEEKLLITTDEKGSMWFLDVSSALNPTVIQGIHGQLHGVSSVKVIRESSVILVGTMVGEVQVFKMDITDRSNIRIKKELEGCTSGSEQVRQVYLTSRNELIAAFSNGSLCIYGKNLEFPECKSLTFSHRTVPQ